MENIQKKHIERKRTRCKNCKQRVTLYIFKDKDKKLYCACPKCGAKARFFLKRKI